MLFIDAFFFTKEVKLNQANWTQLLAVMPIINCAKFSLGEAHSSIL